MFQIPFRNDSFRNDCSLAVALALAIVLPGWTEASEQDDFFERKIRPVLVDHCYECHAGEADVIQGGLRLDDPQAMRDGGDSGAAVMPGDPGKSLLLAAIRYDDGLEMPPEGPLSDDVVRDFETWIKLGAVDPRQSQPSQPSRSATNEIDWEEARASWAFQSPRRTAPPRTSNAKWNKTAIDPFVLARLDSEGLSPNPQAEKSEFIRRVSFDLTGLPPTPAEVEAYLLDERPGAKSRLVERLLASPAHAEHWARMWLDVARYAEDQAHKVGNNDSLTYPNAYYYRDWVIGAFADDMPYDDFVRLQLAADLINPSDAQSHLALGFIGLGPKYYRRGSPEVMADEWEDRIDTVTRGLLGLTVACARCHDHKYDPITMADYYGLAGVFASTEMFNRPIDDSVETQKGQSKDPKHAVHIVRDGDPQDVHLMIRGDVNNKGPIVERRFLQVFGEPMRPLKQGSGRADLAEAIVDRENPLTARVIVNRVWSQFFGRPLVATPSNFGALGSPPTHPELLDDLAVRFMDQGWSMKWLEREIVLSAAYGQSSVIDPHKSSIDPENKLIWRVPRRRLGIEAFRDALLFVSGRLEQRVGGESMQPDDPESRRRTLYSEVSRMDLNPLLARFDFPDPNSHSAKRFETTTPLQKLFLLNSPFLINQADELAKRLQSVDGSHEARIEHAYQLLWLRDPTAQEVALGEAFVSSGDSESVWPQYAQALLISNEMFMVD